MASKTEAKKPVWAVASVEAEADIASERGGCGGRSMEKPERLSSDNGEEPVPPRPPLYRPNHHEAIATSPIALV